MNRQNKRLFADLMNAARSIRDYEAGKPAHKGAVLVPPDLDAAAIRKSARLTQQAFADALGVPVAMLRLWERGQRHPEGPAAAALRLLHHSPAAIDALLSALPSAMPPPAPPKSSTRTARKPQRQRSLAS